MHSQIDLRKVKYKKQCSSGYRYGVFWKTKALSSHYRKIARQ